MNLHNSYEPLARLIWTIADFSTSRLFTVTEVASYLTFEDEEILNPSAVGKERYGKRLARNRDCDISIEENNAVQINAESDLRLVKFV